MKYISSIIILALIVIFCTFSYLLHPQNKSSNLEMRSLATFNMILHPNTTDSVVYKNTALKRLEETLKDQFICRDFIIKNLSDFKVKSTTVYDSISEYIQFYFLKKTVRQLYREYEHPKLEKFQEQRYTLNRIGKFYLIENTNYISLFQIIKSFNPSSLSFHINQIQHIKELYPQIKIYSYFVSSIDKTPWFDSYVGIKTPDFFEQIAQALPDYIKVSRLIYRDFEEYKNLFFASDHHLNCKGSYKIYRDIYDMLSKDISLSTYKEPVKEWDFTDLFGIQFRGLEARILKEKYTGWDKFIVFEYDLGNRKTSVLDLKTLKEIPAAFTRFDNYKKGNISLDRYYNHYSHFYCDALLENGDVAPEQEYVFIIRNNGNTGHNVLLVSDSTGAAIKDVLGTHFDTLVYLDYNIMSKIDIDYIIDKYKINILLLNGFGDILIRNKYVFRFSDNFGTKENY